jgi:tetratricopeptide (TPR) repeat protein
VLVLTGGCSSVQSGKGRVSANYRNPAIWIKAAEENERKGDLQSALINLKVARTVSLRDRKINVTIERLEAKIASQSKKKMSLGNRAVRQGKLTEARHYYLQVLALNPKHKKALAAMRKLDKRVSKASMKKKVARSTSNYNNRPKNKKVAKGFHEEAYTYSRQEIVQAEEKQTNPGEYIKEIETHLMKYPKDKEVHDLLSKALLEQAGAAFEAENYNDALRYLEQAEHAFKSDARRLEAIQKQRKAYGKALYIKGVRHSRDKPAHAIKYWEYALKFDPNDKRSQLRLRKIQSM